MVLLNLLGLLLALLLSFASSGMETSLYRVSRVRMRIQSEQGNAGAGLVLRVLRRLDEMVTTILIDNNIAAYAGTFFFTTQLAAWKVPHASIITTAIVTPLFFVLTESLPKQLAYGNADRFALICIRFFEFSRRIFSPFVWLLNRASRVLRRLLGSDAETTIAQSQRTLLMEHLNAGVAENVLTEEQNRMAIRIMELESITAGDCMIPIGKLPAIPQNASRQKALSELSRRRSELALLVDDGGRITNQAITLAALVLNETGLEGPARTLAEPLEQIKITTPVPEVLNLFREKHARRALILQGSRIAGLITTKSALNKIAGIG